MMTQEEIEKLFPYGLSVHRVGDENFSFRGVISSGAYEPDPDSPVFSVWQNPYHDIELSRDLKPAHDGWETTGSGGVKYFLRPLSEGDSA